MKEASFFDISTLERTTDDSMISSHMHSFYELFYLTNGECDFTINDQVYHMQENTMIIIPKNTMHKTTYLDGIYTKRIGILFSDDYLYDILKAIGVHKLSSELLLKFMTLPDEYSTVLSHLIKQLSIEVKQTDIYSPCITKSCFQQFIALLLRHGIVTNMEARNNNNLALNNDKAIQMAAKYINDNFMNPITLSSVAKHLHLNPSYFSKKFKTTGGLGFKEYLNKVRITHAEKLLLETDWPMTKIAYECGFETSNYFGDAFKQIRGISPSAFRKNNGQI